MKIFNKGNAKYKNVSTCINYYFSLIERRLIEKNTEEWRVYKVCDYRADCGRPKWGQEMEKRMADETRHAHTHTTFTSGSAWPDSSSLPVLRGKDILVKKLVWTLGTHLWMTRLNSLLTKKNFFWQSFLSK